MRLLRLELDQVRKFDRAVRIEGFAAGLNLLAGPNEMGKSTVLAALQAVLFERHRAGGEQVRALCPEGSRAAPRIALDFELEGRRHRIEKRFLINPSARLSMPDGARFEDDEAEDELQRLLGFGRPSNRGPSAESLGSWGVLWVAQGGSVEQATLAGRTRGDLHACLVAEVDALVGIEEARRLRAHFAADLHELIERRGQDRPKGAYRRALDSLADERQARDALGQRQGRLDADLDRLAAVRLELGELEDRREDARMVRERDAAQEHLREAQARAARIRAEESELRLRQQEHQTLLELARARTSRRERIDALAAAIDASNRERGPLAAEIETAEAEAAGLRAELARLEESEADHRRRVRAARARDLWARRARELEALRLRRGEVETAHANARGCRAEAAGIVIEPPDLDRIRMLARELERLDAERRAFETRVRFDIAPAALAQVRVQGQPLASPKAVVETAEPLAIEVEGLGTVEISPVRGGQPLAARARQLRRQLDGELARAGVPDLEGAEQALLRKQHLQAEARGAEERGLLLVESALPGATSVDHLVERIAVLEQDLAGEAPDGEVGDPAALEAALDMLALQIKPLRQKIEQLAAAQTVRRERDTRTRENVRLREHELARLRDELEAELRRESDPQLKQRVSEAAGQMVIAKATLERLQEQAAREPVPEAEAGLARLERAIQQRSACREALRIEASALATGIAHAEGEGLGEAIAAAERRCARLEAECAADARQVQVLKLLIESLDEAGRAAREDYFGPLLERLRPHLETLFPGAEVRFDDDGQIVGISREASGHEPFQQLSDGTREQIAILVRLAFAELLADHGRPAMVVLDDALVFADEARLARMFEVLVVAARKVQILVLTCRERAFADLAANRVRLVGTAEAAAA